MLKAFTKKHTFEFITPGGTSRGILKTKDSWYIVIYDDDYSNVYGIGECSIIKGLSIDNAEDMETKLDAVVNDINNWAYWLEEGLDDFPSIRFGLETAIKDIAEGGNRLLFTSEFTEGRAQIPINGLVWMGDYQIMRERLIEKIKLGYRCVKIKIGAIDFADELNLLKLVRADFSESDIELRVDANGAFTPDNALEKLKQLSQYNIQSIEQPIMAHQREQMAELCKSSPIPIALDEELIGLMKEDEIGCMLDTINPQYIVVKPSLLGGLRQSQIVINEAEKRNIEWWVTSALEGNIGLNAIAQWTYSLDNNMAQGLGTGMLFKNNIPSPLSIEEAGLFYDQNKDWDLNHIL